MPASSETHVGFMTYEVRMAMISLGDKRFSAPL